MKDTISDDALTTLVQAGGAHDPLVTRGPGGIGWRLQIRYANGDHLYTLRSKREPIRVFRTLESLSRYCDGIGLRALRLEL